MSDFMTSLPIRTETDGDVVIRISGISSLGQALMAFSLPVVLASDQSNLTISLPSGAATSALQTTGNTSLSSIDTKLSSTSTSALQTTGNSSLSSIDSKLAALVSGRMPVDGSGVTQPVSGTFWQATQPVSGTFWQTTQPISGNLTNISGTISLPTGASTSSLQTTGNTSLSSIDGKLASLGQKAMSGSVPVTIASDQASIPVAATLSAETTKVIGTVNIAASQTLATVTAVTAITNALPVGANVIGKVSIDQTTPGTTNLVSAGQNGTWNITNVSGTVSLPAGASTEATLVKLPVAQASTTSGQSGPLIQAATQAYDPLLTPSTTNPLVLTPSGELRVKDINLALSDILQRILYELQIIRLGMTVVATQGTGATPDDLIPTLDTNYSPLN